MVLHVVVRTALLQDVVRDYSIIVNIGVAMIVSIISNRIIYLRVALRQEPWRSTGDGD